MEKLTPSITTINQLFLDKTSDNKKKLKNS